MSSDISQAFDHPEARARATQSPGTPPDRISLRDHVVSVEIGAFQSERGTTQRVAFNVVVEVAPPDAPLDDDVDRILSYDTITEAIAHELAAERLNLLETLAERIAERILAAPMALRCFVRVEKLDRGPGALGVEIVRAREQVAPLPPEGEEVPHPLVLFLSNPCLSAPGLTALLDRIGDHDRPAILCVGPADLPAPQADHPMPQRRIDLLAIEQNAWVLASRDDRCVVTATRTELDWAMKHGRISVWAPSKLVLDTVDSPRGPVDALALAAWLAEQMQASEIITIGTAPPDTDLPARELKLETAP